MTDDFEFKLPDVGEGVHEGEIVEWHVDEGDTVAEDEDIVDVMTDKATVQISAPVAGTIKDLVYDEGDVVDVGEVFVVIAPEGSVDVDADEDEAEPEEAAVEADAGSDGGDEEKTLFELPDKQTSAKGKRPARRERSTATRQGQVLAMPRVRHKAKQEGVDLARVEPTGSKGHVTMEDLEQAIQHGTGGFGLDAFDFEIPEVDRSDAREVEQLKGLRKRIWESMSRAKTLQPHFTYVEQVRADKLVQVRNELKELGEERGVKVTYLPLITKAVVRALREHPRCNALVDEETRDLVVKEPVNMGIAAATDKGLTVPVVQDAHEKSILDIAADVNELGQKAQDHKLSMDELTGGTFTITSLGRVGGLMATPIINHPQVAIMGVHAIRDVPVVEDGEVVPGKVMNLSFSFDHRLIDGYDGALFAQDVKRFLEDPNLLLLESR